MSNQHPFTIYNASAGSGKTFTLVKEYLKILLQSNNPEEFKYILAITFTNKAVSEMKERIIETLRQFSSEAILVNPNSMFILLSDELEMTPEKIQKKSKNILNRIIYNYAAFDVSTIDGFTHKIIRTFAYDLKLSLNFEVELDQNALLSEAVDSLIAKAGTDKALTKILIDFAIEKADDDKSWDIAYDFNKIATLLISENDIPFIESLKDKSIENFTDLKSQIKRETKTLERQIIKQAQDLLTLLAECSLQFDDFSRSSLPKHFENLTHKKFDISFDNAWQVALINNEPLYPKRVTQEVASIIDDIQPQLIVAFNETRTNLFQYKFLNAFYKNITPLSVLNAINKELVNIKKDQNKMMISEFNTIISEQIKGQPTPFIYERLGEKFRNFFIDEFQDTSKLQWENLIPLIDNSLSGENVKQLQGTALLVGDAKQAIYRWRGGKAEQFINLFNEKSKPFNNVQQQVKNLPTNYRSFKEIITFNNAFFNYLSQTSFSHSDYSNLYMDGAKQNAFIEETGYIKLDFLNIDTDEDKDVLYPQKVLETIQGCLDNGFKYEDICILIRKKKEGVAVAEYLNAATIPIMSSETMLIYNSPDVQFIDHLLNLLIQPENDEIKIKVLNFLANKFKINDKHHFFEKYLRLSLFQTFKDFENHNIYINLKLLLQLSIYDIVEAIIRHFKLVKFSNAYIQFYLDFVLEYSQKQGASLSGFLEHSNLKKDTLSIVSPQGQNAVQIMTIHKSKGLEFPVVIFPYADLNIYKEQDAKEWYPLNAQKYNGFSSTLINYNKDFENYGEIGQSIYAKHQAALELDNINLLYVALTRPVEQLYIISKGNISANELHTPKTYAGLFINFLKYQKEWLDTKSTYTFGKPIKIELEKPSKKERVEHHEFISTPKESHNIKIVTSSGYLWNTEQAEAIEKGNLIHNIMALINTRDDIAFAISHFLDSGIINELQVEALRKTVVQIVEHPELKCYFTAEHTVYNERDIISKNKSIIRPDRLIINSKNEAIIIDYKTGSEDRKHKQQLENYQNIIEEMPFLVTKKILIYINEGLKIVSF